MKRKNKYNGDRNGKSDYLEAIFVAIIMINAIVVINKLGTSEKKTATADNLLQKKDKWKQPAHKTAHLQTAQADTETKFAKELFSCRRTR